MSKRKVKMGKLYTDGKKVVHAFDVYDDQVTFCPIPGSLEEYEVTQAFLKKYPREVKKIIITEE